MILVFAAQCSRKWLTGGPLRQEERGKASYEITQGVSTWSRRCEAPSRDARRLRRVRRSSAGGARQAPQAQQGGTLTAADGEGDVERHRASLEQDGHAV